jgi:hypothetical protein
VGWGLRTRKCWCRVSEYSMVVGMERAEKALPKWSCVAKNVDRFCE